MVVDRRGGWARQSGQRTGDLQTFAVAYEDDALLVVDKPAGVVVHPARGHESGTLAQALADRAAGGEDPIPRRDRAPPGPRHLGAAGGRQERCGAPRAEGAAAGAAAAPRVPGAGRRRAAGATGHDRRADRARPPRPACCTRSTPTRPREARTHFELLEAFAHEALLRVVARDRAHPPDPRAYAGDRAPGAGRSAPTGDRCVSASSASSCTRRGSRSRTRVTGDAVDVSSPLPADLQSALDLARGSQRPAAALISYTHVAFLITDPPRAVRSRPASGYARSRDQTADQRWSFSKFIKGVYKWLK